MKNKRFILFDAAVKETLVNMRCPLLDVICTDTLLFIVEYEALYQSRSGKPLLL